MPSRLTRRQFLAAVGGAAVTMVAGVKTFQPSQHTRLDLVRSIVTPTEHFFQQQIGQIPHIDPDNWTLTIGGMVETALIVDLAELQQLQAVEIPCTLACIGNRPGGKMIGHALWRGVRLSLLLERAGVRLDAKYARLMAWDGYSTTLKLAQLARSLVVYEMSGKPLSPEHGFPARLIVPGLYGYKMPKWIAQIALTDTPQVGYWEQHGWSPGGVVQTISAIYSPHSHEIIDKNLVLQGMAFAGDRSIARVEIQVNDGLWQPAALTPAQAASWRWWDYNWVPPESGEYRVRVRAADSEGFIQQDPSGRSFPNGSCGIHEIMVRVS